MTILNQHGTELARTVDGDFGRSCARPAVRASFDLGPIPQPLVEWERSLLQMSGQGFAVSPSTSSVTR
jgi:hypothetical protein